MSIDSCRPAPIRRNGGTVRKFFRGPRSSDGYHRYGARNSAMTRTLHTLRTACLGLAALALLGALPGAASAVALGFRNDLNVTIAVQITTFANKKPPFTSPPFPVKPGNTFWDTKLPPGDQREVIIFLYDPNQPNRPLTELQR